MAKKFGKFLLFTAAVGSAAAAVYYYIQKKNTDGTSPDDEDYDDFSEDLDEDAEETRNYVPLTPDSDDSGEKKEDDSFVPLEQVAQNVDEAEAEENSKAAPEVEEFFNEGDGENK